jgi:hypothetical protein
MGSIQRDRQRCPANCLPHYSTAVAVLLTNCHTGSDVPLASTTNSYHQQSLVTEIAVFIYLFVVY